MRVNVCYRVPVVCVVDTETQKIERVVVDDESISEIEYCETADKCDRMDLGSKEAKLACGIAETEEWPRWEFGF